MFSFGPYKYLTRPSLHPDLQRYLVGDVLGHPLLSYDYVDARLYSRLNQLYEYRSGRRTRSPNEWDRLRPDLSPFDRTRWYSDEVMNGRLPLNRPDALHDHDRLVGQIWTDPELVTLSSDSFLTLHHCVSRGAVTGPCDAMMTEGERRFLADLPDRVRVFRGHVPVIENRPSWTLNPIVALAWSTRSNLESPTCQPPSNSVEYQFFAPIVTVGTIEKSRIVAYFNRRREDEILTSHENVIDRQSYEVMRG